jgi:ABC-type polysaccharide/polyol phosphate export permease
MMNLVMLPMWVLSGIFFSASRYPEAVQPFLRLLPLTALIDALRAVTIDGAALTTQAGPVVILSLYAVVTFTVALKIFRWQ